MQARVAVEGAVALLACARVSPAFLDRLGAIGAAMLGAIEAGIDPMAQDQAFHMAIAEQTGNSVLSRIVASLFDERFSRISARLSSRYEDRGSWTGGRRGTCRRSCGRSARATASPPRPP